MPVSAKFKVIVDYQSPYTEPFFIKRGEAVQIGERDTEWPGWIWCTNAGGKSRWVPESYLHRTGDKGLAVRDYEATELSVQVGEQVTGGQEVSGWVWCTNRAGASGWVPKDNLMEVGLNRLG